MSEEKQNNTPIEADQDAKSDQLNPTKAPFEEKSNATDDEHIDTHKNPELDSQIQGNKPNDSNSNEVETSESTGGNPNEVAPPNASLSSSSSVMKPGANNDMRTEQVNLGSNDLVFSDFYESKKSIFLANGEEFLKKRCPLFILKDGQIQRLFFNTERDSIVEELFELWKLGYRTPELGKYFVHYFASCNSDRWKTTLFELLVYKDLPINDKYIIKFLYQDVLDIKITVGEFLSHYREDIAIPSLDISIEFNETRKRWTRQEYKYWTDKLSRSVGKTYDEELLLNSFYENIIKNTNLLLLYSLMRDHRKLFAEQWSKVIEKQVYYHGEYRRLSQLSFQAPEYKYFTNKEHLREENVPWHAIELILKGKVYYPLHMFYLKYTSKFPGIKSVKLSQNYVFEMLQNLTKPSGDTNYVPQRIRYILFLYFMIQDDWQNLSYSYDYLNSRFKRLLPRIFYARALFKRREYEKAWQHILEAWNENKANLLLMNDAAVYAYHAGRLDEAEEIFHKMRAMFPNNSNVLYNESLFLQYKANIVKREEMEFSKIEQSDELSDSLQQKESKKEFSESEDIRKIAG